MAKQVVYYIGEKGENPVWNFLNSLLPDEREKCFEYIAYLEQAGEKIRRPVGDYVGNKIYELRPKQTRILYFFMLKDHVVLVHAFRKKTDAIPEREMQLARTRMNDFILRHQKGQIRLGGERN